MLRLTVRSVRQNPGVAYDDLRGKASRHTGIESGVESGLQISASGIAEFGCPPPPAATLGGSSLREHSAICS